MQIATCQAGYEPLLRAELARHGMTPGAGGRGWLSADGAPPAETCFAHLRLDDPRFMDTPAVNAQAAGLLELFLERTRAAAWPEDWPLIVRCADPSTELARRAHAVEREFRARLARRARRLERSARSELPRGTGAIQGFFVLFTDFAGLYASTLAHGGGQRRMADDPEAPSRSYLKVEEAYAVLGAEPAVGETVIDLGAAPGGWSYSAARRGARVIAVDNGPLKGGALNHPLIEQARVDAFTFRPAAAGACDWLFCDMVEEPHQVLRLVESWLRERRCRRFVVNLKFGRADAVALLAESLDPRGRLRPHCELLRARHLFHDRDEFTLVGCVRPDGGRAAQGGSRDETR